jgi:hypothetical protein
MNMKNAIHTLLLTTLATLTLASCITGIDTSDERQVEIALAAGAGTSEVDGTATRATHSGDPRDRYINSLRVLGFRVDDGTLAFNNLVFYQKNDRAESFNGKILVRTGRYTLVLIANEHADSSTNSVHNKLEALQPGVTNLSDLGDLWFGSGKTFDSSKDIPMVARVDNVKISSTGQGNPAPGITNLNNSGEPLRITLIRLGVRLELRLKMYPDQVEKWWDFSRGAINLEGIPDRVYLFPRENSEPGNRSTWIGTVTSKPTVVGSDGLIGMDSPRIILPEILFSPVTNKRLALSISIDTGERTRRGTIAIDGGVSDKGYTIPRNSYLKATATAKSDRLDISTKTVVDDWESENLDQKL